MNQKSEIASTAWVGFALQHSEANRKSPSMSNPVIAYEKECAITQDDVKVAYNIAYKMGIVDMDKIKANHTEYAYLVDWVVFLKVFDTNHVDIAKATSRWSPLDVYFNQQYEATGQVINALVATIGHVAEELQKPCEDKTEHTEIKSSFFDTDRHILVNVLYAFCFIPTVFWWFVIMMCGALNKGDLFGALQMFVGVVGFIPSAIITWVGYLHLWTAVKKMSRFVFTCCKRLIMWMDGVRII